MKKSKQNTKSFVKLFAKYKLNQLVKPKEAQDPFQVKFRFMDIDNGVMVYLCVNRENFTDTFIEENLEPYTPPLQLVKPDEAVDEKS